MDCPVCLFEVDIGEIRTLNCNHQLCNECLDGYLKSKIFENQVDVLNCPTGCGVEIPYEILKSCVDRKTMDKYDLFKIRKLTAENSDEKYF